MSFLFPANPKDGDVLVQPQEDGRLIKGTYDEATNTWAVGELPEEPGVPGPQGPAGAKGEKGDPGKGMAISGIVPTYDDLPSAGAHPLQFWIVDDENNVYYSDGNIWYNQGGPVVGPKGEDGADGTDGADGVNGSPGKGWESTTIIDERPSAYYVRFNSDDGLTFTTDNIMGPQGEVGSLQVASETNLGGIKIGRGLSILPDGTLQAGETSVDLETVPLTPEGTVYNYSYTLGYSPSVYSLGSEKDQQWLGARHDYVWSTGTTGSIPMPDTANRALVYLFSTSECFGNPSYGGTQDNIEAFRAYMVSEVFLEGGTFEYGRSNALAFQTTHNLTFSFDSNSIQNRYSILPVTKINEVTFETGASLKFDWQQTVYRSGNVRLKGGVCRLIIVPFREDDDGTTFSPPIAFQKIGDTYYYDRVAGRAEFEEEFPPATPEEINSEAATVIKTQINYAITAINNNLEYVNEATKTTLISLRDQLYATRDQPGTYEDVVAYAQPLVNQVNTILRYQFRFE